MAKTSAATSAAAKKFPGKSIAKPGRVKANMAIPARRNPKVTQVTQKNKGTKRKAENELQAPVKGKARREQAVQDARVGGKRKARDEDTVIHKNKTGKTETPAAGGTKRKLAEQTQSQQNKAHKAAPAKTAPPTKKKGKPRGGTCAKKNHPGRKRCIDTPFCSYAADGKRCVVNKWKIPPGMRLSTAKRNAGENVLVEKRKIDKSLVVKAGMWRKALREHGYLQKGIKKALPKKDTLEYAKVYKTFESLKNSKVATMAAAIESASARQDAQDFLDLYNEMEYTRTRPRQQQ